MSKSIIETILFPGEVHEEESQSFEPKNIWKECVGEILKVISDDFADRGIVDGTLLEASTSRGFKFPCPNWWRRGGYGKGDCLENPESPTSMVGCRVQQSAAHHNEETTGIKDDDDDDDDCHPGISPSNADLTHKSLPMPSSSLILDSPRAQTDSFISEACNRKPNVEILVTSSHDPDVKPLNFSERFLKTGQRPKNSKRKHPKYMPFSYRVEPKRHKPAEEISEKKPFCVLSNCSGISEHPFIGGLQLTPKVEFVEIPKKLDNMAEHIGTDEGISTSLSNYTFVNPEFPHYSPVNDEKLIATKGCQEISVASDYFADSGRMTFNLVDCSMKVGRSSLAHYKKPHVEKQILMPNTRKMTTLSMDLKWFPHNGIVTNYKVERPLLYETIKSHCFKNCGIDLFLGVKNEEKISDTKALILLDRMNHLHSKRFDGRLSTSLIFGPQTKLSFTSADHVVSPPHQQYVQEEDGGHPFQGHRGQIKGEISDMKALTFPDRLSQLHSRRFDGRICTSKIFRPQTKSSFSYADYVVGPSNQQNVKAGDREHSFQGYLGFRKGKIPLVSVGSVRDIKKLVSFNTFWPEERNLLKFVDCRDGLSHCKCAEDMQDSLDYDKSEKAEIFKGMMIKNQEQKKLLAARKLCLVLCLDGTLLDSVMFHEIDPKYETFLKREVDNDSKRKNRHLVNMDKVCMWTKLRPGIWEFLEKAEKICDLYFYTMGTQRYAMEIAKVLNLQGSVFFRRAICWGGECTLFGCNEVISRIRDLDWIVSTEWTILIADAMLDSCPRNMQNFVYVQRYTYFPCSIQKLRRLGPSVLEKGSDEIPENGKLASTFKVITNIHRGFFDGMLMEKLDVRKILALEKKKVLEHCRILFSHVFPITSPSPHLHPLWKMAEQLGAVCTREIDEQVTHVVAARRNTYKVSWGHERGKFVVNPSWVEESALLCERAREEDFIILKSSYKR